MYYTEVMGKKTRVAGGSGYSSARCWGFTKAKLVRMKKDDAVEEDKTFIANNVEELAATLSKVWASY